MSDDDTYTEMVLEESTYELIRRRRGVSTRVSIQRKIRWCGGLLLVAATILPIVLLLPDAVREAHVSGPPSTARPSVAVVLLFGVACLVLAAAGLAGVVVWRSRIDDPSEDQAWTLVGVESILTGIGFVTGALSVVVTLAILGVGHAGLGTVERLVAAGVDPYRTGGNPVVTVRGVAALAVACSAGAFALAAGVDRFE